MANLAARMMLSRNGKSFPFHLLRGSVSPASTNINLAVDPRIPPQIPLSALYLRGEEPIAAANGYNTLLLQSPELNRVDHRRESVSSEDEDEDEDEDDSEYGDLSDVDVDFDDDDVDDDDEDDEVSN